VSSPGAIRRNRRRHARPRRPASKRSRAEIASRDRVGAGGAAHGPVVPRVDGGVSR
jgi:hypothetical protein